MKGVILAGGTGSRLFPSTKVTNKHLLPVFDKPMIFYPIQTLKNSGVRDILIITSGQNAGDFMKLLGSGQEHGVNFTYKIQDGSGGIAQALSLSKNFANNESIVVILADNIFEDDFSDEISRFKEGVHIFAKKVDDPERFGVIEIDDDGLVKTIEEKPIIPKSNLAQTGIYLYDNQVFDFIDEIEPSKRGELEITDVNQKYLDKKQITVSEIMGMWTDAGTHNSLIEASMLAQISFDPDKISSQRQKLAKKSYINPKITIGIATYNCSKYIKPCLESILNQDYPNFEVKIFDNHSTDNTREIIHENFQNIDIIKNSQNIGFARAHNQLIKNSDGEFYACLNSDVLCEKNFISELVKIIETKPMYGSAGGKLKKWNFESFIKNDVSGGKTNFIDSVGLKILKSHKFEDIGQGEVDFGQYDGVEDIFGVSGAAVLYRRKALDDISFVNDNEEMEYFDESMFMYKEDIDLAYRLQWASWKSIYTPNAIGYHDRTVSTSSGTLGAIKNRLKKSKTVNKKSLLNHKILLEKNFSPDFSAGVKGATFFYNTKVFLFILIFETELLGVWWNLFKMRKRLKKWKKTMPKRVSKKEIEEFMK